MAKKKKYKPPEVRQVAPPKGNEFWKLAKIHGNQHKFVTPGDLYAACCEYFQWVDDNPLWEDKVSGTQHTDAYRMRPATIKSLCLFIGVAKQTWYDYAKKPGYAEVCEMVTDILYEQKFAGAAAGLLHPVIISRDLGLRDKQDVELTGKNGGPIEFSDLERAKRVNALLESARARRAGQSAKD